MGSLIFPARLDRSHCFQTHENPAPPTPTAYPTPTQIILPFGAVSGPFPFPKPISLYIYAALPLFLFHSTLFSALLPPITPKTNCYKLQRLYRLSSSSAMAKIKIGINGTSMPPNQPSPTVSHNNFNFTKLLLVTTCCVLKVWKDLRCSY